MTLTLEISPEREATLMAQAQARGVSAQEMAAGDSRPAGASPLDRASDPEEWARQFRAWADSHDPNTPILSDEAMSL